MTPSLLLNYETKQSRLLLQNARPTKASVRKTKSVAGCNCDRWGHPCPDCIQRNMRPKEDGAISLPLNE
jgi:hypothetical protein